MNVEKRLRTSIKTISILSIASAAAISACSGPGGNQRDLGSQSEYIRLTEGVIIPLSERSSIALEVAGRVLSSDMRLLSDDAADEIATRLPFFVGWKGPFTKTPCRNAGGDIEMIKSSTSISHTRMDDSTNQFQASQSFTVKANSCKVNLQSDVPDTAIVGGSVDVVASSSGSVSSKQLSYKFPFDTDAELKLSGSVNISLELNGTPWTNVEIEFGDFELKFQATRQMTEEMLEIHSNPLGREQAAEQMKDYLSENILCRGSVILSGAKYPCEDFGKYLVDVLVNKNYGLE
jgi:hypothetical protein